MRLTPGLAHKYLTWLNLLVCDKRASLTFPLFNFKFKKLKNDWLNDEMKDKENGTIF
jgi:hypothetical protein